MGWIRLLGSLAALVVGGRKDARCQGIDTVLGQELRQLNHFLFRQKLPAGKPLGPLQRLMPWAILGFTINLVTGFLFFAGDPFQYIHNIAFGFKLIFIGLAGVNVILFYVTGLYRRVDGVGAGHDVPPAAKLVAATSLFLWVGVMYWGRMLPFIGNAF